MQEQMILMYSKILGISGLALRYQNVYGPGQSLINPYTGIMAIFSSLARKSEDIRIFEDGKESRDFVFIDDDPINREFMKTSLPQVQTVDLPKDPSKYTQILEEIIDFNVLKITDEDKKRGLMYSQQKERKSLEKFR